MSLFRVKELWSTRLGEGQDFAEGSLCVDASSANELKVVVASLNGILKVFRPRIRSFSLEDQLRVIDLHSPILHIAAGHFVAGCTLCLAVLHQTCLRLFVVDHLTQESTHAELVCIPFPRPAANMTHGPLLCQKGMESIVVQSLDGELYYVQNNLLQNLGPCWSEHLLPGPMVMLPVRQALVTSTAMFELASYAVEKKQTRMQPTVEFQWKLQLGEMIHSIAVGHLELPSTTNQGPLLVCIGETSLFYISVDGDLLLQKRLEFLPVCLCVYPVPSSKPPPQQSHTLIAAQTGNWMIYRGTQLLWSAKGESSPLSMTVAKVDGVDGVILVLDDKGQLSCNYLGTRPNTKLLLPREGMHANHEQIQAEYKALRKQLREDQVLEEAQSEGDAVTIRPVALATEEPDLHFGMGSPETEAFLDIQLEIVCTAPDPVTDCDLLIVPPTGTAVNEDSWTMSVVDCGEAQTIQIPIRFSGQSIGDTCRFILSYTDARGLKRVAQSSMGLSMGSVYKLISPIKDARYRFVVETEGGAVSLKELFVDMVEQQRFRHPLAVSVLTFQTVNGICVTIIASKSAGRYRVQSDSLQSILPILKELEMRLTLYLQQAGAVAVPKLSTQDALPMDQYFKLIEGHLEKRQAILKMDKEIQNASDLYRAAQKRMLCKFKESQSDNLQNLKVLLDYAYGKLMQLTDDLTAVLEAFRNFGNNISQLSRLLICLLRLRLDLSPRDVLTLETLLISDDIHEVDMSWEDSLLSAIKSGLQQFFGVESRSENRAPMSNTADLQNYFQQFISKTVDLRGLSQ